MANQQLAVNVFWHSLEDLHVVAYVPRKWGDPRSTDRTVEERHRTVLDIVDEMSSENSGRPVIVSSDVEIGEPPVVYQLGKHFTMSGERNVLALVLVRLAEPDEIKQVQLPCIP
jgi:hypothetical protein